MDRTAAARAVNYKPTPWRVRLREEVQALLRFLHTTLTRAGVPYFILNGTLLGATKFEGIIPWDDDADVGLLLKDVPAALAALKPALVGTKFKMSEMLYGYGFYGPNHGILDLIIFDLVPNQQEPVYQSCYPLAYDRPTFLNHKILNLSLPAQDLYPLRPYRFDNMILLGPAQGRKLCLRKYGADVYEKNRRPDLGWGIHPLVPYLLPPVTKVVQAVVDWRERQLISKRGRASRDGP